MSAHSTDASDSEATGSTSTAARARPALRRPSREGSLAMLLGGGLLGWAVKTVRTQRRRGTLLALAGVALLGVGARRRRTERLEDRVETGADARRDAAGRKAVSDDAHAQAAHDLGAQRTADESRSVYQSGSEPNPRGMSDRSDVGADEGDDVEFVEGREPGSHPEPQLDDAPHDPRLDRPHDGERTQIDLSEAAMADEASEAAGPLPEQSYPSREGTDPEPTAPEAPEWVEASDAAAPDADDEGYQRDGESRNLDDDPHPEDAPEDGPEHGER